MSIYTGDYGNDHHRGDGWDGITCTRCGAIATAYLCGDCLEENLATQPMPPEDKDWHEEVFEVNNSKLAAFGKVVLVFALLGVLGLLLAVLVG